MATINSIGIDDWFTSREINGAVKEIINTTDRQRLQRTDVFSTTFPYLLDDNTEYHGLRVEVQSPMAEILQPDQTPRSVRGGKLQDVQARYLKMASLRTITEEEQIRFYRATKEYGINLGVTTYPQKAWGGGTLPPETKKDGYPTMGWIHPGQDIAAYFFDIAVTSRRMAVFDRMDYLTAQILQFGRFTYTDPGTGYTTLIDWTDPDIDYQNFTAPLTQTGPTSDPINNDWSDLQNARGLEYLQQQHLKYVDRNGTAAYKLVMTRSTYYRLLNQEATKSAVQAFVSSPSDLSLLSAETFNKYIAAYDVPPIQLVDDKYDYLRADGTIGRINLFNNNIVCFLAENMGKRRFGVVMKSKPGLQGPAYPGIYSDVFRPDRASAVYKAMAEAYGAPIVHDAKQLQAHVVSIVPPSFGAA